MKTIAKQIGMVKEEPKKVSGIPKPFPYLVIFDHPQGRQAKVSIPEYRDRSNDRLRPKLCLLLSQLKPYLPRAFPTAKPTTILRYCPVLLSLLF